MRILVMAATMMIVLSSTSTTQLAPLSVAFRVGAIAILFLAVLRSRPVTRKTLIFRKRVTFGAAGLVFGHAVYLAAATLPHGLADTFISRSVTVVALLLLLAALVTYFEGNEVVAGFRLAINLILVGSLTSAMLLPTVAFEEGRLRGLLENANALGFVAALGLVIALATNVSGWSVLVTALLSLPSVYLSQSRASALMLVMAVLLLALVGLSRARAAIGVGLVVALLMILAFPNAIEHSGILRAENTRLESYREMLNVLEADPWFGRGFDYALGSSGGLAIAGSPAGAAAGAGWVGLSGLIVSYFSLIAAAFRLDRIIIVYTAAGIAHSLFESSFLSLSGPMMMVFLIGYVAVGLVDRGRPDDEPLKPGIRTLRVPRTSRTPPADWGRRIES